MNIIATSPVGFFSGEREEGEESLFYFADCCHVGLLCKGRAALSMSDQKNDSWPVIGMRLGAGEEIDHFWCLCVTIIIASVARYRRALHPGHATYMNGNRRYD